MKILVVGSGGREHALVKKLKESDKITKLYACPGNGGISADAECVAIKATDIEGVTDFCLKNNIDFVVVAPDDPLVLGMVDALNEKGIKTFGPRANAAILEGSKVFSKNLMKKYNIPTARYETFDDANKAIEYIKQYNEFPVVIKADGLALGKGVIIPESLEDAIAGVKAIMEDKAFGKSGNNIVIEEFLEGVEVSILAFTDGKTVKPMISSMDHKRSHDNDKGLNTGGMGTISPNPHYTEAIGDICMQEIFIPTIEAMQKEGREFSGCLYFGLMLTKKGPYVIEYNCRFGDPETQVVLPMLKTDLLEIMLAIWDKKLFDMNIEWHDGATACVVLASGGYPEKYETGYEIAGLDTKGNHLDATIYHAGTKLEDGKYKTNGGRVLGVTVKDNSLIQALAKAYKAVDTISFDKKHYRKDIGAKAL